MRAVAIAVAGLLLATASTRAQSTEEKAPTCRANQRGEDLITRIEYPDGYAVEGPWHVTGRSPATVNGTLITASLDRIVETDAVSHRKQTTSLPSAVEMTFAGGSLNEVLQEAANVWCKTVMQAHPPGPEFKPTEVAGEFKIML